MGHLLDSAGNPIAYTLEKPFAVGSAWAPAVPQGVYTCQRGMHRLEGMTEDFEAFEIMNVPGHTGILFHVGNYVRDTSGCCLLGNALSSPPPAFLEESKDAFNRFMALQAGVDTFQLTVS